MTCLSFDKFWLYRQLDKFYMRETDINRHLATVLQIFSVSTDLARFLPPIYHEAPLAGSVWFLDAKMQHIMFNIRFCQISAAIWRHLFYRHYGYISLFTESTANSILFLFNIRWTIRMKCYLQYSQWKTERSLCEICCFSLIKRW